MNQSIEDPPEFPIDYKSPIIKPKRAEPNFARWLLGFSSGAMAVLGPLIIYLGYQASEFGVEILIADRGLMGMGGLVCMLGLVGISGLIWRNEQMLIFYFYSSLILIIFLSVFAVGAYLMTEDIANWIDRNWDKLRTKAAGYGMESFKMHARSEIQSLAAFSLTVNLLEVLGVITVIKLIPKRIKTSLLPVTNLILSILGSALIAVSIYSRSHSNYTKLPVWTNYIFALMGLLLIALGVVGYYAATHSRRTLIQVYAWILGIVSLCILAAGIGFILLSSYVMEYLQEDWPAISEQLRREGFEVQQNEFGALLKMNLKFAGLFGVVNFCFFLLAILGAIILTKQLERRAKERYWMG